MEHVSFLDFNKRHVTLMLYCRVDKQVYKAASIKEWMVIIYADHSLVSQQDAKKMVVDLIKGCQSVGEFDHSLLSPIVSH